MKKAQRLIHKKKDEIDIIFQFILYLKSEQKKKILEISI